ncbi:TRAP transporter small permease subunit [Desulfovibrio sp. SGI.169]|uniref:TRAP transporter small permease subunit n=1 Tax=Desulfovibrio sp. SGI.169 TaxID=3420561 RepID=UPI003D048EDB
MSDCAELSRTSKQGLAAVPPAARKIVAWIDRLNERVGKITSWLVIPMVLAMMYEVIMRNVFTAPSIWALDVVMILYAIHFMLGSPFCLQTGNHIRTDFFYHSWSIKTKALVDMFNYLIFFFPIHIVFLDISVAYAWKSYIQNEVSVTSPWMPIIWPAKMALPFCVALTLIQGVSEVIKCWYRWKTNELLWDNEQLGEAAD